MVITLSVVSWLNGDIARPGCWSLSPVGNRQIYLLCQFFGPKLHITSRDAVFNSFQTLSNLACLQLRPSIWLRARRIVDKFQSAVIEHNHDNFISDACGPIYISFWCIDVLLDFWIKFSWFSQLCEPIYTVMSILENGSKTTLGTMD